MTNIFPGDILILRLMDSSSMFKKARRLCVSTESQEHVSVFEVDRGETALVLGGKISAFQANRRQVLDAPRTPCT